MIGQKFGMLLIIRDSGKRTKDRGMIWSCKCDCGRIKDVSWKLLKNESKPRSCGCSRQLRSLSIFESNYEKTEGCWIWKGVINKGGYGRIGTTSLAHRRSYEYAYGKIPKGKQICHICDNRICVRPDHMFIGTISDNMKDKTYKGRQAKGSKIANSILTEEIVLAIRKSRLTGKSYHELSAQFKISWYLVRSICKNRGWKHVELGEECKNFTSPYDANQLQHIKS